MSLVSCVPMLIFVALFVGSGIYQTYIGQDNAFYLISPVTAIIPATIVAWILNNGDTKKKMDDFLGGICDKNIMTMCIIFLLAGAFSEITKHIGSVDAVVSLALNLMSDKFLLIGVFAISSLISMSIGTSMGTIAVVAPIVASFGDYVHLSPALGAATVVGGAMFGDNLSLISDTTIAAVSSQNANPRRKFKINAGIAIFAYVITLPMLINIGQHVGSETHYAHTNHYHWLLITPYVLLLIMATSGLNVFASLCISILCAVVMGILYHNGYDLFAFNKDLRNGFAGMQEIMLLSLLVGGLSGLNGKGMTSYTANEASAYINRKKFGPKVAQCIIAATVSIFDILIANNAIAILLSGEIAKKIAQNHKVPPEYSAAWLDIFSCIFQGLIPYGAQILLVSTIVKVSPLAVITRVFYCYALLLTSMGYICFVYRSRYTRHMRVGDE